MSEAPVPIPSRPGEHRAPCPNCAKGRRDDALAIRVEPDGSATWICHRCGERGGTRGDDDRDLRSRDDSERRRRAEAAEQAKREEEQRKVEDAWPVWDASGPISGTPAERYLRARGLDPDSFGGWPETLAWCADADGRGNGALVVAVNHGYMGLLRGVQRIFLQVDGTPMRERDGSKRKRSRGVLGGNSARLSCPMHPEGHCGLAEGAETALAAWQITGTPTWAVIFAHNMPKVRPPHWARHIVIFADNDANQVGLTEAGKAMRAFRAIPHVESVRVLMAEQVGADIADFLNGDAAHAG